MGYLGVAAFAAHLAWQVVSLRERDGRGALILFRSNRDAGLILFVFQWQAYLWPLLIAPDPEMRVAPVAIAQFAGQQGVDFGAIFAGATLTALVPLLILLFFQRYFTQSVSASGSR